MIIESSSVGMRSSNYQTTHQSRSITGTYSKTEENSLTQSIQDLLDNITSTSKVDENSLNQKDSNKIRLQTINWLLKMLFYHSKAGKIEDLDSINGNDTSYINGYSNFTSTSSQAYLTMQVENYYYEAESTNYSASGSVVCADGRTIDFGIEFGLSRSLEEYSCTNITQALEMMDPLVINLDSNPTEISDQKFYFDLDCDGQEEELSNLALGSAFLAIDLNNDGLINDGSELFGTKSGDGFADLAMYDSDGNGWIDEADQVFSRLKVVTFDSDGKQNILNLSEADVGAIYLQSVETEFDYKDEQNQSQAALRSTGIFLHESGYAGTISHVDLAVG